MSTYVSDGKHWHEIVQEGELGGRRVMFANCGGAGMVLSPSLVKVNPESTPSPLCPACQIEYPSDMKALIQNDLKSIKALKIKK